MPERRRLIVNADDFGFNRDVNAGIIEAHRGGVLTATTLMANGDAFDDAVALARRTPTLDIGCHLVLVQGRSVLDPSRELPATLKELLRNLPTVRFLSMKKRPRRCESWWQREFVRAISIAINIRTCCRLFWKQWREWPSGIDYQIPWVRRPFDFGTGSLLKRVVSTGMKVMSPRFATTLQGLRTTEHFTGFLVTGVLTDSKFAEILERLPPGLTEFMCHPGRLGSELSTAATRLKESREVELAALLSPLVRKAIEQHGIELTNFRDA